MQVHPHAGKWIIARNFKMIDCNGMRGTLSRSASRVRETFDSWTGGRQEWPCNSRRRKRLGSIWRRTGRCSSRPDEGDVLSPSRTFYTNRSTILLT
jgi:hypothetical protein